MEKLFVEQVFMTTGVPSITYVEPEEYLSLIVAIRTEGKGVVIEGPSGIGKTTAVKKALQQLGFKENCQMLSARKREDLSKITEIAEGVFSGVVIIDDFHRLPATLQQKISDVMKVLADAMEDSKKIIVVGINKVGDSLVKFSPDLNNRIATIRFETNSSEKIAELISKGEKALNIKFDKEREIVEHSNGSFHIAQLMCQKACILQGVVETNEEMTTLHFSYPQVEAELAEEFSRSFFNIAREFATGPRLRREGRAPYLHILKWLSSSNTWSVNLSTEMQKHPNQKAGVIQIAEKGFLSSFLSKHVTVAEYIHYDSTSRILSVEDPKFMFYLKSINWNNFAKDIGYVQLVEEPRYDFALSFAGSEREIANKIFLRLKAREIATFYDNNEQAEILGENIEEYLYPIYKSDALFVVPLMSKNYPNRIWTKMESKAFKERFGKNSVIPIWFDDVGDSMFDISKDYGGITFKTHGNQDDEIDKIVTLLAKKIEQRRIEVGEI